MGASAYFLVVDGTRKNTVDVARELNKLALGTIGDVPFILLINKSDLRDQWEITEDHIFDLNNHGWIIIETSAKKGSAVEEAFQKIAGLALKD